VNQEVTAEEAEIHEIFLDEKLFALQEGPWFVKLLESFWRNTTNIKVKNYSKMQNNTFVKFGNFS